MEFGGRMGCGQPGAVREVSCGKRACGARRADQGRQSGPEDPGRGRHRWRAWAHSEAELVAVLGV